MSIFKNLGDKLKADFKRAILGGGNQNAGVTPIDRKSLQKENRMPQFGDRPNFLSGGRVVPTYGIDTNKSYLENLYILNNDEGAGGGLNGVPVPPTTGFGPAKYSPEEGKAYDMGASGVVYNKETGVRELPDGLNGRIQEMQQRLDGSVGSDNSVKDEQQAREKINNVHKPILPEGTPTQVKNLRSEDNFDYNSNTSSKIAETVDQRKKTSYPNLVGDPDNQIPKGSTLTGDDNTGQASQVAWSGPHVDNSHYTPIYSGKDRGAAQAQYEKFKNNYDSAMQQKLNDPKSVTSSGVLSDVKPKSIIDQITRGAEEKYEDTYTRVNIVNGRTTGREERTFEKSPYMKMPSYSGLSKNSAGADSANARIDKFNALSVLDVPRGSGSNNPVTKALEKSDFVALYFHDLVNKKYIPFRAFINSMSDQFDATWNGINYLGRADAVQIYGGCGRTFSIDFTAHALGVEELHPMWQRINHLCGLTKPASYTESTKKNSGSSFIEPPMIKFNLGDLYKNQPAIITSVAVTLPNEGQWELSNNSYTGDHDKYDYLNKTIQREQQGLYTAKYPTEVTLSVSMTFLEKRLPETTNRHFGDHKNERPVGYASRGERQKDTIPVGYGQKGSSFNSTLNTYPRNPEGFETGDPSALENAGRGLGKLARSIGSIFSKK